MKVLVDAKKYYDAIIFKSDKDHFDEEYGDPKRFSNGIHTILPNHKTISQNSSIWRDWTEAARLLYCTKEYIYYRLQHAEEFSDIWLSKIDGIWTFRSLSSLSKAETSDFIPRYREWLQAKINEKYGEWTYIQWSSQENLEQEKKEQRKQLCCG